MNAVYSWKKSDCELCKKPFPKHVSYQNKINDLINIEIPKDKPYIILESIAKEKKVIKTLFIFSAITEECEIKLVIITFLSTHIFLFNYFPFKHI